MRARRLRPRDEVVIEGESVVLVDRQVLRISALGTSILAFCENWKDVDELTSALVEEFGSPPGGSDPLLTTVSSLEDLKEQGLVEVAGD